MSTSSSTSTSSQRCKVACLLCRKSKVKCSGTVPCDRCVRRGTQSSCATIPMQQIRNTSYSKARDAGSVPVVLAQVVEAMPIAQPSPGADPRPSPVTVTVANAILPFHFTDTVLPKPGHHEHSQSPPVVNIVYSSLSQEKPQQFFAHPSAPTPSQFFHSLPLPQQPLFVPGPGACPAPGTADATLSTGVGNPQWGHQQCQSTDYLSNGLQHALDYPASSVAPPLAAVAHVPAPPNRGVQHSPQTQHLLYIQPHAIAAPLLPSGKYANIDDESVIDRADEHRTPYNADNGRSQMLLSRLYPNHNSMHSMEADLRLSPMQLHVDGSLNSTPESASVLSDLSGSSSDMSQSRTLVTGPPRRNQRPKFHTFMLFHTPTIRRRVAHLKTAAQMIYNACASARSSSPHGGSPNAFVQSINERLRATFKALLVPLSMDAAQKTTGLLQRRCTPAAMGEIQRTGFQEFLLGVICMSAQQSQHKDALAHEAHQTLMQRVQSATAVLELRKATLNKLPLCVLAKALYPDWTAGGVWANKRAMQELRIDPKQCPNQIIPVRLFLNMLSHPVTNDVVKSHIAFSIANTRPNACQYRALKRTDGTVFAALLSTHHLLGPAPYHRMYFSYMFIQALPIQPLNMDSWAENAMVRLDETSVLTGAPSAKYPGIMHKLIQDHIEMHPQDRMALPPCPDVDVDVDVDMRMRSDELRDSGFLV
jgi:Fungal Zn(2)-Cys(6) binuclear cluster domain